MQRLTMPKEVFFSIALHKIKGSSAKKLDMEIFV